MAAGGSTKAVVAAMIANGGIAIAKFVGFGITRSSSMLAEAIHSVADTGNQALLLFGGKQARKVADDEHQFGYGRERYFWSFVVSLVLFALGAGFAIFEGIEKIRHPHEISNVGVALVILGGGILLEGWSFNTAVKEARPLKGDDSWWHFVRHSRVPELAVVLLEDLGAQVGLILAFAAVLTAHLTENPVWDGIGTLSIGILLLFIAVLLIYEMRSLLIGEGATERDMGKIIASIEGSPKVVKLIHLKTQHLSPDELLVAVKIAFEDGLTVDELSEAINEVERRVRKEVPHARPMYVEPGFVHNPDATPNVHH